MSESSQRATRPFLATCPRGLEELLADELRALGAEPHKTTVAGVHFRADLEVAYRACLWSRLANRIVLSLLREENIERPEALHRVVAGVDWSQHLPPGATLAVDFHGRSEQIRHTRFGAQTVKDGVVDALQAQGRPRPGIDLQRPDLRLYAHLHRGRLTLGVDLSGDSLHRRGYRRDVGHAPLKENLAAALLIRAGWPQRLRDGEALVDPLCGAGTLLIEAALMAADMAPNLGRVRFGFHGWAQHDEALWAELKREAEARASIGRKRCRNRLYGFDQSPPALAAAKSNAMRAGIPALIAFSGASLGQLRRPAELDEEARGLVITNPPYGERLGELPELVTLYGELGEGVRRAFPGWRLAVFTANPDLGHRIGLRADKQYSLKNGPLEAKLLLMDVRAGAGEESKTAAGSATAPRSEGAQMFANRLEKNRKRLRKWLKQSGEACYRLYDADMPEYALAVDVYDGRVHVQEYAPPRSVNADQAQKRLFDALQVIPEVLDVDPGQVVIKRREKQSGKAQYLKQAATGERFQVREGRARLWINLRDYLDTGLFLDHRPVRRMLAEMAPGRRFLNLFCYTAAATVQAALGSEEAGGAVDSVSVDLSNTYLEWARDNFALNGLDPARHRVVRDDCLRWLETARAEFDLIFLDPPTFSNSKKMEGTLDVQRDHVRLVTLAMARLAPGGTLVFSNNQRRFQLDEQLTERFAVEDISARTFDPDFTRRPDIHHVFLIRHREVA
ncbi:bifunctional 23S rRNA (guanine(2069)-N(7))-methyltransferase RlmK/23S rRNA (guanine(2445)-N(2))-methyltransferase RlmL [Halomonas sp. MCCC 1A17488]|uniref:bifunctional 23S rRNA (guanine(2069)-N(7))-methyltransferase RlmK/23S rRNA (guanine(2445)-N(2))-methyltransferase RlmL n=1 Tax=unclassified Halomonas TaxID=2609666 RepID=UPI0018D24B96|nr:MULTISPECIES: bifunctional 23S rRNA (guanine(2069)-N(7))-methyltransferase RlmK/23S rRNA (guanine(2445)-N(2))-methyltransferase RlmL [unclassified Halomonas]MCE8015819.1 bifunctional 23S rRNA (guanine(2069)-N(7))-methyltransferase RlmK/23S rRNA (guanine(2445)-N(2))-methyltransferase RlmL [Halomonas sp. MCCC 1A17488]MCG3239152.1 bifunctional 23S rRNA (guanine(2069)-N(7))-methyltransferase RlmK/23S rRNA (guanine(2445)-N(2))-methyltransferase RlmL [Halomonas sp. MCCC 1A17488]QPP50905.1 bifunctio